MQDQDVIREFLVESHENLSRLDQELVELRTPSLGQPGKVKFIDFALEDFRCLLAAHRTGCPADFWRGDFPIGRLSLR